MKDGDDIREHARKFFDAVDKLSEMDVQINPDLLAIMLLYSLPPNFENFRCAIESRDDLPTPETLRIKIIEESDARKSASGTDARQDALITEKKGPSKKAQGPKTNRKGHKFKGRCYKCGKADHKAPECKTDKDSQSASDTAKVSLYAKPGNGQQVALRGESDDSEQKWCLDSGCTSHLCKYANNFVELDTINYGRLNLASNASTDIKGKGSVNLLVRTGEKSNQVLLNDTLHVPELRTNLMSVAKITDRGFKVIFDNQKAEIVDSNNQTKVIARRERNLYFVHGKPGGNKGGVETLNQVSEGPLRIWHNRLGHLNLHDLREAIEKGAISGIKQADLKGEMNCEICIQGKIARPPFPRESKRATKLLDIIHTDVCGPMRILSNGEAKYFVTFIDDCTRWCEVRFMKSKNEMLKEFKSYKVRMENEHGTKIKSIQSDNGREYVNLEFEEFLKTNGIEHRTSAQYMRPYMPQQNGVAERFNRTLIEWARCSLLQSNLPPSFWAEAVSTACNVRNRCPTKALQGKTPYELRFGHIPPNIIIL